MEEKYARSLLEMKEKYERELDCEKQKATGEKYERLLIEEKYERLLIEEKHERLLIEEKHERLLIEERLQIEKHVS